MVSILDTVMQVYGLGGSEWVIIIIIGVIVIFGAKKIPELARSFGRASTEFERGKIEGKKQIQEIRKGDGTTQTMDREKLEEIADKLGIDHKNKNDEDLRTAIEGEIKKQ
jgi:sec-independent protein translocase protein TatA